MYYKKPYDTTRPATMWRCKCCHAHEKTNGTYPAVVSICANAKNHLHRWKKVKDWKTQFENIEGETIRKDGY